MTHEYGSLLVFYSNFVPKTCTISDIFNVEKYRDLEITVSGQSRSLKVIPFDTLVMVSY